jgi:hypothetical protein
MDSTRLGAPGLDGGDFTVTKGELKSTFVAVESV